MKLAIGLLLSSGFPVPVPFMLGFVDLWSRLVDGSASDALPPELRIDGVRMIRSEGFPVDAARNDVVRTFLASECDALLFLDADMRHPPDLPERLLAHQVPIVTALYFMRRWPFQATAMVDHPTTPGLNRYQAVHIGRGLQPIAVGGAGALLIQRDVLEQMRTVYGDEWFRYQRDPKPPYDLTVSEDFWFYQHAAGLGFQAFCDFDTVCAHLMQGEVDLAMHNAAVTAQLEAIDREPDPVVRDRAKRNLVTLAGPDQAEARR